MAERPLHWPLRRPTTMRDLHEMARRRARLTILTREARQRAFRYWPWRKEDTPNA